MAGHPKIDRGERPFDLRYRKLSLETNELLSSQMTSRRLSSCYGLIVALLLQGLIHRYGPALFRLAVQHGNPMPCLLSPTNAIDDLKIGLYESGIVTRRLEGDRARRQERRDLVKTGSVLRHVPRECGLHQDQRTSN